MPFYDGSFNCRFHFMTRGFPLRGRRGSKGGVRRSVASFGITVPRRVGEQSCAKDKRRTTSGG